MPSPSADPKPVAPIKKVVDYRPLTDIKDALTSAASDPATAAPTDNGVIDLLVQRPSENERHIVTEIEFKVEEGMIGSGWKLNPNKKGYLNQICVMSSQAIRVITNSEDKDAWAEAGDQIFMDLDLSKENLSPGDRVVLGSTDNGVILEVTPEPHNGCAKFATRYGMDALKAVNCPQGKRNRWRGIYFKVVRDGVAREGDRVTKVAAVAEEET